MSKLSFRALSLSCLTLPFVALACGDSFTATTGAGASSGSGATNAGGTAGTGGASTTAASAGGTGGSGAAGGTGGSGATGGTGGSTSTGTGGCVTKADCPVGQSCSNGMCLCPTGTSNCGGTCIDTQSDAQNCGACGTVCGAFCVKGNCNDPVDLSAGGSNTCAVLANGEVYCWGRDNTGQLGNGMGPQSPVPVKVPLSGPMKRVVVGKSVDGGSVCGVDGTGGVVCWGSNENGKLGIGQNTPGPFMPTAIEGLLAGSLSLGGDFGLATKNLDVVGWGLDDTWQQGHMNGTSNVPVGGSGETADVVAAGAKHACSLSKGTLKCWGENGAGQLGFGNNMSPQYPSSVSIDGKAVHEVACGESHTCVRLVENGRVKCWGANMEGQLGQESFDNTNEPGNDTLQNATAIAVGLGHSGAVVNGEAWLWGRNTTKQITANLGAAVSKPTKISGLPGSVVKLALGRGHSCALNKNGKIFCWGANIDGQCGTGAKSIDPAPPTLVVFK